MTRFIPVFVLAGAVLCSCGIYFRLPKKAEPNQRVWGESVKNMTGKTRIHDEREMTSWRAPDGYHWESSGTCENKTKDDMQVVRICTWKVVEDKGVVEKKSD